MLARKALAGTAGAPKLYVEDVMSCFLYTGNGSTQTITNNIDLSGEGGLVWTKDRQQANNNVLQDTVRGVSSVISSNLSNGDLGYTNNITAFSSTGYSIGAGSEVNNSGGGGSTYASWTFRKAKKFFDVVTYTGNGTAGRTVSHNLGSVPGAIFVKKTSGATNWRVYHRSLGATKYLELNTIEFESTETTIWNNTAPTSTVFSVGTDDGVNTNGATYVAYLFAHDAGGFGDAGSDNVITCGSYTGNGSATGPTVTLGYEPQWVLLKRSTGATANWILADNMRGTPVDGATAILYPNGSDSEETSTTAVSPTATGFQVKVAGTTYNANGATYIYIAIRRGPMKTPTTGTSVFSTGLGSSSTTATYTSGFVTDAVLALSRPDDAYGYGRNIYSRLQGNFQSMATTKTDGEGTAYNTSTISFTQNDGIKTNGGSVYNANWVYEQFKRAPGFFDVVCYTGTGANRTVSHNLGVAPELMIVKRRNSTANWIVYSQTIGNTKYLSLNTTDPEYTFSLYWNNTSPTSSVFTLGTDIEVNNSGGTYVAYLFASVSGVSKVGSYTGNGSSVTVTTNFQPRFILVKRTDSTGDWIVSDSARGLVAGNDPYLELNTTDAEVTNEDWVDITSTSFTVNQTTNNANVNTGTYIYLAVS